MITEQNYQGFLASPSGRVFDAMTGNQKKTISGASESLATIVGGAFEHTSKDLAQVIAAKAVELNALLITAYVGPNWTDKSSN